MAAKDVKIYFTFIILQAEFLQEQKINNAKQILNDGSGFITIGQFKKKVTLRSDEGKLLRKLVHNMNSIGFTIEPVNVWNEMKNIQNDIDMATFGSQDFEIKILPTMDKDGRYTKPLRDITEIEGQRLDDALTQLKNHGLNIIIGTI